MRKYLASKRPLKPKRTTNYNYNQSVQQPQAAHQPQAQPQMNQPIKQANSSLRSI
jgi:hypothetical protein